MGGHCIKAEVTENPLAVWMPTLPRVTTVWGAPLSVHSGA